MVAGSAVTTELAAAVDDDLAPVEWREETALDEFETGKELVDSGTNQHCFAAEREAV